MNMSPGTGGSASIGMSNVGFLLSFIDDASPHLKRVTSAYRQLTSAMDEAYKKANQTGLFTNGLERIIRGMEKYVEIGHQAVGLMASFSQLSRGKFGKVSVDVKLRRLPRLVPLAEGGIVTRPTSALIGENGPEAVIPLKKWKDGDFRWMRSMVAGGAMGEMSDMMRGLKSDYSDIETHTSSVVDLTKKLREHFGQTRDEMLQTRKVLTTSFDGASYDIDKTFESMFDLRKESELSEQDAIKLSKSLGLVEDFQGENLSKFAKDLSFYTQLSADDVNQLVLDMSQGFKSMEKTTGITIGLSNITEYLEKAANIAKDMTGIWSPEQTKKAVKSMASLGAGMYNAGVDADVLNDVIKEAILGSPEAIQNLSKLGLSAESVKSALTEGHPETIMKQLVDLAAQTRGSSYAASKLRDTFSQVFGIQGEALIDLAARGDKAVQVTAQMSDHLSDAHGVYEQINKDNRESKTLWQQINIAATNFTKTFPLFNNLVSTLEGLLPMLESLFFFTGLMKMSGMGKFFKGFLGGAKDLEKGEKLGLIPKFLFGKSGGKGMKGVMGNIIKGMSKPIEKKSALKLAEKYIDPNAFSLAGKRSEMAFVKSFAKSSKAVEGLFTGLGTKVPFIGKFLSGLVKIFPKLLGGLKLGGLVGLVITLATSLYTAYKKSLPFRIALEQLRLDFMQLIDTITSFISQSFGSKGTGDAFKMLGDGLTWLASLVSTGLVQVLEWVLNVVKGIVGAILTVLKAFGALASVIGSLVSLAQGEISWKQFFGNIGDEAKGIGELWTKQLFGKKEADVQAVRADMGMGAVIRGDNGKDVIVNVDMSGMEKRMDAARALQKKQLEEQKKTRKGGATSVGGIPLSDLGVAIW